MAHLPLNVAQILEYGRQIHGRTPVTSWGAEGPEVTTFSEIAARASALANALHDELGIDADQRVASLMANCAEHLEVFLGVAAMGAVFQPLNKQLMPDQLIHIINHADDKVIVVEPDEVPALAQLLPNCPGVEAVVITGNGDLNQLAAALPAGTRWYSYESLIDGKPSRYAWPTVAETDGAAMCYSTGTEGAPKGVVYSHRSLYLHSLHMRSTDSFAISHGTPWLCCVPIYHVLSWGVPLAAFMCGAPLIFPGSDLSAPKLAEIIETSMPRAAQGVPTLWINLMVHYITHPPKRMSLQEIFSGGSPVPPALMRLWEERYGVDVIHFWGMTETSPVGTVARPPSGASGEARQRYRVSQGRFPDLMEFRIVDDKDRVVDLHDRNQGELQVRGNTVTTSYYHSPKADLGGAAHFFRGGEVDDAESKFTEDGWLRTGDVGSITRDGYLTIHDRARDLIRSGGEWIYSAQLENFVMESEQVVECAVIGMPDRKWGERPLAVTVLYDHVAPTKETAEKLRDQLRPKLPTWMLPEYWAFVDHIDKTSVDKFDKKDLRAHLSAGDYDIIKLKGPGDK